MSDIFDMLINEILYGEEDEGKDENRISAYAADGNTETDGELECGIDAEDPEENAETSEVTVTDDEVDHIVNVGYFEDCKEIVVTHDAAPYDGAMCAALLRAAGHCWPDTSEKGKEIKFALMRLGDAAEAFNEMEAGY